MKIAVILIEKVDKTRYKGNKYPVNIQSAEWAPNFESNILINFCVSFVSLCIRIQNVTRLCPSRLNMRSSFEFSVTTSRG